MNRQTLSQYLIRTDYPQPRPFVQLYNEGITPVGSWTENPNLGIITSTGEFLKTHSNKYDATYEANMLLLAGDCAVSVNTIALWYDGTPKGIIMPRETPLTEFTPSNKKATAQEMVHVVSRLHNEKRIIHGDIKLANFLFCRSDSRIRLNDFASAACASDQEGPAEFSHYYLAPCRVANRLTTPRDAKDDNFALGIAIWEMWTGRRPFEGMSFAQAIAYIQGGGTINIKDIDDAETQDLVRGLMAPRLKG